MTLINVNEIEIEKVVKSGVSTTSKQSLTQWSEVPNHPGLVTCLTYNTNNPVVMMIEPKQFLVEEVRLSSSKTKISDVVTVRHMVGNEPKTSMIVLCEDGSLRIYTAKPEKTNYWLPYLTTGLVMGSIAKSLKKKKSKASADPNVTFPVDFFENCQVITDVEFGGSDLLQIYNAAQIKNRLHTNPLYIASSKPSGFALEISNNDTNTLIAGIRVSFFQKLTEKFDFRAKNEKF